MFLDRELDTLQAAKDSLVNRCAMRRMMLQLDALNARASVRRAFSGLQAGIAVAELVAGLLSGRGNRGG